MTKFSTETVSRSVKGKNALLLLLVMFIFTAFIVQQAVNRFDTATNVLTFEDWETCHEELGEGNYVECYTYLHESGKKDLSALWGGS